MSESESEWDPFADIMPPEPDRGPSVLNIYTLPDKKVPDGAVYIGRGRGSEWGNRFEIGVDGNREVVVAKHREWFLSQPELTKKAKRELVGRDLVCFCSPRACHGYVLLEVANAGVTVLSGAD